MANDGRTVIVIGGGIAGLCAAVYAQQQGYQAQVLEMHENPGGLATSWRRGDYTFETCLHWLLGSNPKSPMYAQWRELFDIDQLTFVNPEEYVRFESESGDVLHVYSKIDRLEQEMLRRAPEDAAQVRHFASTIWSLCRVELPDPTEGLTGNWMALLHDVPYFGLLRELSRTSCREYGERFTDPLLRSFFCDGEMSKMSALALFFSLAWTNENNAGYPIGGSQAVIQGVARRLTALGGELRLNTKVERILVHENIATGVQLESGEILPADWVISAADGHETIYNLLNGNYLDDTLRDIYSTFETFPSYLQISLGIALDLRQQPGFLVQLLDTPLQIDPGTELRQLALRFFHFDPTFTPAGKTSVTCFLPTRNFDYWVHLQEHSPAAYQAEKDRIAQTVIDHLERRIPGLRRSLEVIDVSTPATVIRCTNNWRGSMEGWLMTPATGYRMLPNTLPGLERFLMAGQWVMPGGGLPAGMMTARHAIRTICKHDRVPFAPPTAKAA